MLGGGSGGIQKDKSIQSTNNSDDASQNHQNDLDDEIPF